MSSNLVHGEVYSIHYVIKFVNDLRQVDHHDITEIMLKVALNTININQPIIWKLIGTFNSSIEYDMIYILKF